MRLLRTELVRLVSRPAIRVLVLVALLTTVLFGVAAYTSAQPMSATEQAQAEQAWQEAQADWEENGEQYVQECVDAEAQEEELSGEDLDFACDEMAPQREWYVWGPPPFEDFVAVSLGSGLLVFSLVGLLLGVTFVAAEFGTGAMATWLTFVPRRDPVLASKTAAVAIAGAAVALVWGALFLGANALGYTLAGTDAAVTAPLLHVVLRVGVLGAAVAVIGAGLAFLVRHTAAALGIALGFLVGIDTVLLGQILGLQRFSLALNISAWVNGSAEYWVEDCTVTATGTTCESTTHTITMAQGGLLLLGVTLVVTTLAWLTFRSRDV